MFALSIVSAFLFIVTCILAAYIVVSKLSAFKKNFLTAERVSKLEGKIKKRDKEIEGLEDTIDKYSSSLEDLIERSEVYIHEIDELNNVLEAFDIVSNNIEEFHGHLQEISELKMYYGDTNIADLLRHAKFLTDHIEKFREGIVSEEENKKNQEKRYENKYTAQEIPRKNEEGEEEEETGEDVLDERP